MATPPTASPVNRPLWLLLRRLLKTALVPVARWRKGFRVENPGRLPKTRRPLIVAANHAAFIDSVYLILALRPRFVVCGAKPRLFRNAKLRSAMALANILRVENHDQYLRDCSALLGAGEILLIYPEMGRFPEGLGPFKTWAADVALANGTPILPCYLAGTTRGQQGPPRLVVGEELAPSGDAETLTAQLRQTILALGGEAAIDGLQNDGVQNDGAQIDGVQENGT